ncbi:MAG: CaiB/BaiF CoA transferase family protein [Rhodospirillaceae bacterium]
MLTDTLKGMRIIDLGIYIPGPTASLMLSDLGAEVVKVESPAGDPLAGMGPFDAEGRSIPYEALNRNKTVVTLDLKSDEGKTQFAELVRRSHVLVESFRPGVLDRLGFERSILEAINPHLLHCAISGWGQTGPMAKTAGHDLTHLALSGALWTSGTPDRPTIPFPPMADHAGALMAVSAVLAGLLRRMRTGKGGKVEISLYEAMLAFNRMGLASAGAQGLGREIEELNGGAACYRVYDCKEGGHLAVAPIEPKFWAIFCQAIGAEELIDRLNEPLPQTDLIAAVAERIAKKSRAEWEAVFADLDCCVAPVLTPAEAAQGDQARQREVLQSYAEDGAAAEVLCPILMDGAPPPGRKPLIRRTPEDMLARWKRLGH